MTIKQLQAENALFERALGLAIKVILGSDGYLHCRKVCGTKWGDKECVKGECRNMYKAHFIKQAKGRKS